MSDRERSDPKWENLGSACKFAENQDNPFSGECYESLKNELSVYTTGKSQKKEKKQNRKRVDDTPERERKNRIGTAAVIWRLVSFMQFFLVSLLAAIIMQVYRLKRLFIYRG